MLEQAEIAQALGHHGGIIKHLPAEAIAKIKSSVTINGLNDVTVGLLKNSLDADATRVTIDLDFRRGSCSVDDNGTGIPPPEFASTGGLGQLHHTSKYCIGPDTYGRHGTFLASLAALSLVTITSRHHDHRSINSITLHDSRRVARSTPPEPPPGLLFGQHGTSVTIRNLFGNMPVRVKQRARLDQRAELEKLCSSLRNELVALVVASGRSIDLRVQHADVGEVLRLRRHLPAGPGSSSSEKPAPRRVGHSATVQRCLTTLIDAKIAAPDSRKAWVPVSASTGQVAVTGAICLTPAPSKSGQFVSLGIQPLSASTGQNELFDQINKLFSNSSFGSEDNISDLDELEVERRSRDRSYKSNGYTKRQLRGSQKGVDRWPMFFFHVDLLAQDQMPFTVHVSNSRVREILDVLSATVSHWLTSQNFRPAKRNKLGRASASLPSTAVQQLKKPPGSPVRPSHHLRRAASTPQGRASYTGPRSFNELSRIKSGTRSFYDTLWSPKVPCSRSASEPAATIGPGALGGSNSVGQVPAIVRSKPVRSCSPGAESRPDISPLALPEQAPPDTVLWVDPATNERYNLDSSTGTMRSLPTRGGSFPLNITPQPVRRYTLESPAKQIINHESEWPPSAGWLQTFLQSWDNPVFRPQQQRIAQLTLADSGPRCCPSSNSHASLRAMGTKSLDYQRCLLTVSNTLSKSGLQQAHVISQVDGKFILIKMPKVLREELQPQAEEDVLVLVDQHAADERVRVEALLAAFSSPPSTPHQQHRSKLGLACRFDYTLLAKPIQFMVSESEAALFKLHAAHFARWSILYDVEELAVNVTTLPPVTAERLRTSPQLLVKLLRSEVHAIAHTERSHATGSEGPVLVSSKQPTWLKSMGDCPTGLLDMINSRACRSAIMFNDALELSECQQLVDQLAQCVFPFMCAHGRPSMVPIVATGSTTTQDRPEVESESYASAFKRWRAAEPDRAELV